MSTMAVQLGGPMTAGAPRARWASTRAARSAPQRGRTRRPTRLTRRGRLLLTALALSWVVVLGVLAVGGTSALAGTPGAGAAAGAAAAEGRRVTVRPGETLWAIAQRVAPGNDPRATIAQILDLNALDSAGVQVGQVLLLPR